MLNHVAVERASVFALVGLFLFYSSFATGQLEVAPYVWPGAGRTEIRVQTLAAPGGLDDQNRLAQQLLHVNAKSEFRTKLCWVDVLSSYENQR